MLGGYATGALTDVEWLLMYTHLSECRHCRTELGRPDLPNRAAPQVIRPPAPGRARQPRPGWSVAVGLALVTALVAFGVGYALGVSG
ncbi:hypothetical protein GCM10011581_08430 [Saccharopolyspora subtropica]|uniref:Zinc-finger domain-containing protein n=1 Tax=Saccharopolyspora thermophila TaxID=89367 RepID=A0A917N7W4_9PSEU|nr:hypothetical protein GCM10011581_08430 [Saccharopolyspora subtropica]